MVASLSFAIRIGRTRSFSRKGSIDNQDFEKIPEQMERYLTNPGPIDEAVELVKNAKSVLFLGEVFAPVFSEGALKLMELHILVWHILPVK